MPPANAHKKSPNTLHRQRAGLIKVVHVAKRALGFTEDEYRAVLSQFGAASSAAMSISELERLVKYFEQLGFEKRPGRSGGPCRRNQVENQIEALQEKILRMAGEIENGEKRLSGLVKSKTRMDRLEWVHDTHQLKQILKLLRMIKEHNLEFRE